MLVSSLSHSAPIPKPKLIEKIKYFSCLPFLHKGDIRTKCLYNVCGGRVSRARTPQAVLESWEAIIKGHLGSAEELHLRFKDIKQGRDRGRQAF